jgi:hypothetical protein
MKQIIGRFYFKKTINGNLQGEYSNNYSDKSCTESATKINLDANESEKYDGMYNTSWIETDEIKCFSAHLKISQKRSCLNIFSLKWTSNTGKILFEGEAMLCDKILIGNYYSH